MATCLVTGGAGFLGSHLCDELLARGNRVICVDNFETGSLANIEHIRDPDRFMHVGVDIIEPYHIDAPVDFVYHLASPASPLDYLRLPLMSPTNTSMFGTAFCESIDARDGVTTGISAADRTRTIRQAVDPACRPAALAKWRTRLGSMFTTMHWLPKRRAAW